MFIQIHVYIKYTLHVNIHIKQYMCNMVNIYSKKVMAAGFFSQ